MSVRLPPAEVSELLLAVDQLVEGGYQCGEGTYEVSLADLNNLKQKARNIRLQLSYVQGQPVPQQRGRRR